MNPTPFTLAVGRTLRQFRNQKRITQEALAVNSGVARSYVPRIEAGQAKVSIDLLADLLNALDVSHSEFWGNVEAFLEEDKAGRTTDCNISIKITIAKLPGSILQNDDMMSFSFFGRNSSGFRMKVVLRANSLNEIKEAASKFQVWSAEIMGQIEKVGEEIVLIETETIVKHG